MLPWGLGELRGLGPSHQAAPGLCWDCVLHRLKVGRGSSRLPLHTHRVFSWVPLRFHGLFGQKQAPNRWAHGTGVLRLLEGLLPGCSKQGRREAEEWCPWVAPPCPLLCPGWEGRRHNSCLMCCQSRRGGSSCGVFRRDTENIGVGYGEGQTNHLFSVTVVRCERLCLGITSRC